MNKTDFVSIQEYGLPKFKSELLEYTGKKRNEIISGNSDEAVVIRPENDNVISTSSVQFLEGIHFDLTYTPFHHLGYKLVTAAVCDIYSMNLTPVQIQIDIAAPNKFSVDMLKQFYKGVQKACEDYNIQHTGGDVSPSHHILVASASATGTGDEGEIVRHSGATVDDVICVTGDLGAAMAGLRVLLREKKAWQETGSDHFQPDLDQYEYVVQRQLVPRARFDLLEGFKKGSIRPGAMAGVTRGIVNDLQKIGKRSGTGIKLYSPAVPISYEVRNVADEMQEDVDKYAFYGGEDFEMVFTVREEEVEKLKAEFDDFSVIGKIVDRNNQFMINTGEDRTIKIDLFET
ncbi:MAG: thiamine-phosphate kinase [Balneolaceae bacterium]